MQTQQTTKKPNPVEQASGTVTFSSSQELKALLNFVFNMASDEIKFHLSNEGLTLRRMDPTRVSLTTLNLPKETFEEFECVVEGDFSINIERTLKRVLKRVNTRETVQMIITHNQVAFTLTERLARIFTQPLMENFESDEPANPKIKLTARAKIVASNLQRIMEDLTEKCVISISRDGITFSDSPDDYGMSFSVTLDRGGDSLLDVEALTTEALPITSKYSISRLVDYAKHASKIADIIVLEMAEDMPLKLTCQLAHGGSLEYWLAPRIEAD